MLERWLPVTLTAVIALAETATSTERPDAQRKDRGSYNVFRGALALAFVGSFTLQFTQQLPSALALSKVWIGIGAAVSLGGTALRVWSMRTLGGSFSREVHVAAEQVVVERGPYRLIRHPSYTGTALASIGVGLAMANVMPALLMAAAFALGASYRIRVEEAAMVETLGEPYRAYMKRTKRLVPHVF